MTKDWENVLYFALVTVPSLLVISYLLFRDSLAFIRRSPIISSPASIAFMGLWIYLLWLWPILKDVSTGKSRLDQTIPDIGIWTGCILLSLWWKRWSFSVQGVSSDEVLNVIHQLGIDPNLIPCANPDYAHLYDCPVYQLPRIGYKVKFYPNSYTANFFPTSFWKTNIDTSFPARLRHAILAQALLAKREVFRFKIGVEIVAFLFIAWLAYSRLP